MLLRNLMAMDTEEMIRAQPIDGVVLLGGCDKTLPAQIDGGRQRGCAGHRGHCWPDAEWSVRPSATRRLHDCRRFWVEHRAGTLSREELDVIEGALGPSTGHCMVMGTASTMASLTEALGMALPGCAAIPAPLSERMRMAETSGRRIVGMVRENLEPSRILSPEAFDNAIRILMAVGGSTNAVIHLTAVAGRAGVDLPLESLDQFSRDTPLLASVRPSGQFHMEELYEAGGIPAVMKELAPLLHRNCLTVTGKTIDENLQAIQPAEHFREVIASL